MDDLLERTRKDSVVFESEIVLPDREKKKGLKGDYGALCILLLLYILQGIPNGLMFAIPMILSSNNVSYDKQAIFSFAGYPSIFKVVWAPIVDSKYSSRCGRRKSWIIPTQYLIGGFLILFSSVVDDMIGSKTKEPQIYWLTVSVFFIIYLSATQDTAVDAWGLTLLSKRNIHYVSSCNSVGVVFGSFLSTTLFLSLDSADFCNKWLRSVPKDTGILNMQMFLFGIGLLFIISTTLIWIFKREVNISDDQVDNRIWQSYKTLFKILQLKSVRYLAAIKLTQYIGGAVFVHVSDLKLIQFGVPKETLSLIKAPISFINIFLPFIVVHSTKKAPLVYFYKYGIIRQTCGIFSIALVYWAQCLNHPANGFPLYYYVTLFMFYILMDIVSYSSFMSLWAYTTTVSDPLIGATYMTLFSTLAHIGMKWTTTAALALTDLLTIHYNSGGNSTTMEVRVAFNSTNTAKNNEKIIDGFYIVSIFSVAFGTLWFLFVKKTIWEMQRWPESVWRLKPTENIELSINNNKSFDNKAFENNEIKL